MAILARRLMCADCPPDKRFTRDQLIRIGDRYYCEAHIGAHVKDVDLR
jgi:hypothetical protein